MRKLVLILAVLASLALPATAAARVWPTWGNLTTGDCALAAAADWELQHGYAGNLTEQEILTEYQEVSGTAGGVSGEQLESYWRSHGIGRVRATVRNADPGAIGRVLRHHGSVIVEMAITAGQRWGSTRDTRGGIHFALVLSTNRRGPRIVTWGEVAQMTWWQWREDALLLYVPTVLR
jgi:hypothetical protein